ncbi:ATP-grasp domain-containing protein [Nonomuraea sp. NPDC050328]|uniref:ATP-grasp domain-containing protein n=1 Tax=Nonomuraea sp. NPDC050328 TaxID=3364361 RepID=UPI00378C4012
MIVLVPVDVLNPRRVDEHFAAEANAARDAGLDVALIDHDLLVQNGDASRAVARVRSGGVALYRGWMMQSHQYAAFGAALAERGVILRTDAAQFRRAHELPGWYDALSDVTPFSVWTAGDERTAFQAACAQLGAGPAVLRDYVKSMKHYWNEAAFIPDVGDVDAAWATACRLRQLREDDFVGGFVLRRFEQFVSAEARTWWVDGECRLIGPHPDTPDDFPPGDLDVTRFAPLIAGLGLPFVTVDLALRADGVWRVIEIGDGQVSDRPSTSEPGTFIEMLSSSGRPGSADG